MSWSFSEILPEARKAALGVLLTAAFTAVVFPLVKFTAFAFDSIIYMMPVVVAGVRWGIFAAIASAFASVVASAFLFYAPMYAFQISSPREVVDLSLFIFVAIVTSQLASQLSEAQVRAKSEALRQALIDSVSHELRTPLVSILGAATVLHDNPVIAANPALKELAQLVREEAERLNNDIQNLLDATRISSDGVHPKLEWADPADIINSAIERCRTRLAHHKITIDLSSEPPLIQADPVLMQQALVQILDNARKYSPQNSEIGVSLKSGDRLVRITVRDRGAGLTDDERTQLWGRFFRSERLAAMASGSGLGLWIAKEFVAANGGTLLAESEGIGQGTAITIELPQDPGPVVKQSMGNEERDE
jgi:two-component system sensor histidine kinase KdpD